MEDELRGALEDMVGQFAYRFDGRSARRPNSVGTGGLSALEHAFSILGMDDPTYYPDQSCDIVKCWKWPQAGIPFDDGDYLSVCGDHSAMHRDGTDLRPMKRKGRGYNATQRKERLERFKTLHG